MAEPSDSDHVRSSTNGHCVVARNSLISCDIWMKVGSENGKPLVIQTEERSFDRIRLKAGVKTGTFHDIRRTVISMWFANGMSECEVMRLAGHSDFATTHKFYLTVEDGLVDRARVAVSKGMRQIMVQNGAGGF